MVRRFGQVVRLKPDAYDEYKRLHTEVWAEMMGGTPDSNIRNLSIYHHEGWLFATYEYVGEDFEADMARIAADPRARAWGALTNALQISVDGRTSDDPDADLWTTMQLIFHLP